MEIEVFIVEGEVNRKEQYKEAQSIADEMHERINKGRKAEIWVCHPLMDGEKAFLSEDKCKECGGRVAFDPAQKDKIMKKGYKICTICVLKTHGDKMPEEQRKLLERSFR